MLVTFNMKENPSLSTEDFEKIHGRKPEKLKVKIQNDGLDYDLFSRSEEAYFGENNEYKLTTIALIRELREAYKKAIDKNSKLSDKRKFSKEIDPIIVRFQNHIEKSFNIKKCHFGLIDDLNAFCIPLCFDKNLVERKDRKVIINNKFKASLEDIAETKSGYKYKDPEGKTYCVMFGVQFFSEKNGKELYTDAECAAVVTHEFGHAMQQAVCSINENLASVYIHNVFQDVYSCLNPFVATSTFGLSFFLAAYEHINYKRMRDDDPDAVGEDILKDVVASNMKDFDRDKMGEIIESKNKKTIRELPKYKEHKVLNAFTKFFVFTFGGIFKITFDLLSSILSMPQNIYVASQKKFLKANTKFEQFADIYTTAYGLGAEQSSVLAKLGNNFGFKQDYGLLSITNYIPVINIITGVSHYMNHSIQQLVSGYPDTTGRMAAIYKSLQTELDTNKELSASDKQSIRDEIDTMNNIYNEYVYDWSPKGFVYALWHKITFKNLKNTATNAETNVIDALKDINKENKFKNAYNNKDKKETKRHFDSNKLASVMFTTLKNLKGNYGKDNEMKSIILDAENITKQI